jgi:hypothetical protein
MTTPPAARPRKSLIPGILLGVLAVLLLGAGGIVYGISAIFASGTHTETVEIPNSIEADFEAGTYSVWLDDDSTSDENDPVSQLVCVIENAGETHEVRGADRGGVSLESGGDEWVGDFSVAAGPTTVTCDFASGRESTGYFYFVAQAAPAAPIGTVVLLVLGGILLLGAGLLILRAVLSRRG